MKIESQISILFLAIVLAAPNLAAADHITASTTVFSPVAKYCDRLSQINVSLDQYIAGIKSGLDKERADELTAITSGRNKSEQDKITTRSDEDKSRQAFYDSLTDQAASDAEKQAAANFISNVTGAVSARRLAVDTATANYRQGFDQLEASTTVNMDQAVSDLAKAKDLAMTNASSSCQKNQNQDTIKRQLRSSLAQAEKNYNADQNKIKAGSQSSLQLLDAARAKAIGGADTAFNSGLSQARATLRLVLKKNI